MSAESLSLDAAAPKQTSPLLFELPDAALSEASTELQKCIRSGDLTSLDTILYPWKDPKTPSLVTPEAREHLNACPLAAMETGQFWLAQYLFDKGIRVDSRCSSPAIAHALDTNSTLILEMLLEHGWETEQVFNVIEDAVMKSLFKNERLVQWLLSHGASSSAVSAWGSVPIERAAQYAPLSMLKLLVERGGRVQSTDAVVKAAIGDAEGEPGRLEVVQFLAGLGAPIDAYYMQFCDYEKWKCISMILIKGKLTALHHAAKAGKQGMATLLLELGADKSQTTFAQKTALDLAVENGHENIVVMLQN